MRLEHASIRRMGGSFHTNAADDEDLGGPSITVPARQLFRARQSRVLTRIRGRII